MIIIKYSVKSRLFGDAFTPAFTAQVTSPCLSDTCLMHGDLWTPHAAGGVFPDIICNFRNLISRQIFKYSQLNLHSGMKATPGRPKHNSMQTRLVLDKRRLEKEQLRAAQKCHGHNQDFCIHEIGDGLHQLFVLTKLLALHASPGNFA